MFRRKRCTRKEGGEMKKAVISVLVGTAVLAFVACGKNAATENSSDSGVSTVSASSQVENGQKATRVNQGTNLSPGSPKNIPSGGGNSSGRTHHSETHHSETHHSDAHHDCECRGLLNIHEQKQTKGYPKRIPLFLLVGKTIQCYTEHEFDAKSAAGSEKTAGICQYTRTCAAGNSGRMEKRK